MAKFLSLPKVFISYRRDDTRDAAKSLRHTFIELGVPSSCIFLDVEDIPPGASFPKRLKSKLHESDIILVLIGSNYFKDPFTGANRLQDPNDWVRQEIETGLNSENNKLVVPVVFENPKIKSSDLFPGKPGDLPPAIAKLAEQNVAYISAGARDKNDIEALAKRLGLLKHKVSNTNVALIALVVTILFLMWRLLS